MERLVVKHGKVTWVKFSEVKHGKMLFIYVANCELQKLFYVKDVCEAAAFCCCFFLFKVFCEWLFVFFLYGWNICSHVYSSVLFLTED